MPSSGEGYRMAPDNSTGFQSNPTIWSYGMTMPWQSMQQSSHQLAFPMPLHIVTPQMNPSWFPMENFTSLPPKPRKDKDSAAFFEKAMPSRRYSDPGPGSRKNLQDKPSITSQKNTRFSSNEDEWNQYESHLFIDEARKDRLFNNLLQELRTARDLNRQLCLELHKANMKLHLTNQQHASEQQPGSVAVLVRKLYEAHHIRSDILSNWSKLGESCGRKSSYSSNKCDLDDQEDALMKEREALIARLQSTEKKIQRIRNSQWTSAVPMESSYCQHTAEHSSPMSTSRCVGDVLSFAKLSRSHSFAMSSPSTSDPPSLEDVDVAHGKQCGGTGSTNTALPHLIGRPFLDGRAYVSNSNVLTPMVGPSLKRDIELQLATVERDRRQLEHQLQDTIGTRRLSEDRIIKLERLVSVLRKKLEMQTTIHNTSTSTCSAVPPSPIDNSRPNNTNYSTTASADDYVPFAATSRGSHLQAEGPASLPSYLQVVGPITQL